MCLALTPFTQLLQINHAARLAIGFRNHYHLGTPDRRLTRWHLLQNTSANIFVKLSFYFDFPMLADWNRRVSDVRHRSSLQMDFVGRGVHRG